MMYWWLSNRKGPKRAGAPNQPLANAAAEARSVRDSNKSYDKKFKDFQHAEPALANRVTYGEVSLVEAQKLAEGNAARRDALAGGMSCKPWSPSHECSPTTCSRRSTRR